MKRSIAFAAILSVMAPIATLPSVSRAAGFAVIENSAKGLGRAFAGGAAVGDDASTVYFNPAGMTALNGVEAMGAFHVIAPNLEFTNQGSRVNPLLGGAALTGPGETSGANPLTVPNMFGVISVGEDWRLGIGMNAPFGLVTEYANNWPGRYQALKSDLVTINVNPSAAYRVNDWLSVGAGFNIQYIEAELSQAIDFGSACLATLGAGVCVPRGLLPQAADGSVNIEGDDTSFGYNAGIAVTPMDGTRIGLHYRSKISHTLEGRAAFTVPANATILTAAGSFRSGAATAKVAMPETISASVRQQLTKNIAGLADATFTRWSRFEVLTVQIQNAANQVISQPENWSNAWRYSAGLEYDSLEKWALRTGVAFDETPVSTAFRTPRVPDANRIWMSLGGTYRWNDTLSLDAGYTHIWIADARINQIGATGDSLIGTFKDSSIDIFSFQANIRF